MESCSGAHFFWGELCVSKVHEVRLMPAQYVKPYVQTNKSDFLDAEAIAEAVQTAGEWRFVLERGPHAAQGPEVMWMRYCLVSWKDRRVELSGCFSCFCWPQLKMELEQSTARHRTDGSSHSIKQRKRMRTANGLTGDSRSWPGGPRRPLVAAGGQRQHLWKGTKSGSLDGGSFRESTPPAANRNY